jgi:hypothetical protein
MTSKNDFAVHPARHHRRPNSIRDPRSAAATAIRPRGAPTVLSPAPTREVLQARLAGDMGRTEITQEGQALTLGARAKDGGRLPGDVVLFSAAASTRAGRSATSSTRTPVVRATPQRPARRCSPWRSSLVELHRAGKHTSTELAELFSVARSTVYRAIARARRDGVVAEPASSGVTDGVTTSVAGGGTGSR